MEAKNILDVEKFVVACNDMLSGKFLDLNKRLDKFLTVMTKSEDILELLSTCLEDFDEDLEFEKAFSFDKKTGIAKVSVPNDDKKKLALSVTVFNDIINDKINANQFLETYFQDKKGTPMQNFLEKIVRPYRDVICKLFELDTDINMDDIKRQIETDELIKKAEAKHAEEEQFPYLDSLLQEVIKTCNQILAILKFEKKRTDVLDDVEFITNSILQACEKRDLMVINGLVIGLNYASKKFKTIKSFVLDLNSLIYDYYDFLAGDAAPQEEIEENEEDFDEEEIDEE